MTYAGTEDDAPHGPRRPRGRRARPRRPPARGTLERDGPAQPCLSAPSSSLDARHKDSIKCEVSPHGHTRKLAQELAVVDANAAMRLREAAKQAVDEHVVPEAELVQRELEGARPDQSLAGFERVGEELQCHPKARHGAIDRFSCVAHE